MNDESIKRKCDLQACNKFLCVSQAEKKWLHFAVLFQSKWIGQTTYAKYKWSAEARKTTKELLFENYMKSSFSAEEEDDYLTSENMLAWYPFDQVWYFYNSFRYPVGCITVISS